MEVQLYKTIENDIKEQIKNGKLMPGDKLPSEVEMMELYQASKMTVRKSISDLEQEGLIYSIQRVGNYVATPATDKYILHFDELKKIKGIDRIDVINTSFAKKEEIATLFTKLAEHARVLSIKRIFYSEELIIAIDRTMILYDKLMDISEYEMIHFSFALLMAKKLEQFTVKHELILEAVESSNDIADMLDIPHGEAVALITQKYFNSENHLAGISQTYCLLEYIEMDAESI